MVRYSKGSKALGIDAGEYARVERVDPKENSITVRTDDSQRITYDPRRLQGVTLYHEAERMFARGDRVQLTAPDRTRDVANRELGTIERIDADGRMGVRLDSGRTVSFEPGERRHLDYGYAVTSHSSQGQTADRVLVHVETERAGEQLVNRRLAYVGVSRGRARRIDATGHARERPQRASEPNVKVRARFVTPSLRLRCCRSKLGLLHRKRSRVEAAPHVFLCPETTECARSRVEQGSRQNRSPRYCLSCLFRRLRWKPHRERQRP